MLKKTDELLTGNDRFEGYCIDLMAEIASRVKFNYEIRLVADQNYGAQIEGSENWNGMVGELIERVRFLFDLTSWMTCDMESQNEWKVTFTSLRYRLFSTA